MITWNSTLETGHPVVDNDHKQLVAQLNGLSDALHRGEGKQRLLEMIVFLDKYARQHFAREEAHMRRVVCPKYTENCQAHAEFAKRLAAWTARLNAEGASTSLVLEVYGAASRWLQSHIVGVDCGLRGCVAKP